MTDVLASTTTTNWLLYKGISPPANLPTYSTFLYLRQKLMYAFPLVASSRRCGCSCSYTSSCSSCMNKNATYDVRRALHNIDDHTVLVVDVVDVVVLVVEVESLHPHQPGV